MTPASGARCRLCASAPARWEGRGVGVSRSRGDFTDPDCAGDEDDAVGIDDDVFGDGERGLVSRPVATDIPIGPWRGGRSTDNGRHFASGGDPA